MKWRVPPARMAALLLCIAVPAFAQSLATEADWQNAVRQTLAHSIKPPPAAREMDSPVTLKLRVAIRRDGAIDTVTLVESSGNPVVDDETIGMVRRSGRLPAFSADMTEGQQELTLPVRFYFNGDAPPGYPATRKK